MRGMPYNLQGKGVVVVAEKWKKAVISNSSEPTSVLDTRRSPSPTSTSTLSSSLGGSRSSDSGGGGGGGAPPAVAAVSGHPQKWPLNETSSNSYEDGNKKEEWASDLQPMLEIGNNDKGLAMEDWENIISGSPASPSQDHSLLKWIMREMDDPSSGLKLVPAGSGVVGFEDNGDSSFGLVDPSSDFGFSIDGSMDGGAGGGISLSSFSSFSSLSSLSSPSLPSSHLPRISNPSNNSTNLSLPVKIPGFNGGIANSIFTSSSSPNLPLQLPLPLLNSPVFYQQTQIDGGLKIESIDEKPHLFHHHQQLLNQSQNSGCFFPLSFLQSQQHELPLPLPLPPHPKRHQTFTDHSHHQQLNQNWPPLPVKQESQIKVPYSDSGQEIFLRKQQLLPQHQAASINHSFAPSQNHLVPPTHLSSPSKPKGGLGLGLEEIQQQPMVDQLFKAAEQIENGNSALARAILARLNHQLSPVGKPLQRAASYFMEALQLLLITSSNPSQRPPLPSHLDVVLKIGAYKLFSEVSPLLQFAHFTCNQALLEALDGFNSIHIIDFEIGLGGQWASFMQEIALKIGNNPCLKITAFTSPAAHDLLELGLARENLTHFANDLNISFEFNVLNLDSFDPSMLNISDNEAIAVNFPISPHLSFASNSTQSLLHFVRQISPKIVVSIDRGCDHSDLSFSRHFVNALHSYSILLESLDAMNVNSEALFKIERFLIKPRIESTVAGRHRAEKPLPWKNMFFSAGFTPVPFSNFTETQAEWVVKRHQVRGFHVEKQHTSLLLCWQQKGELISATAWRC